MFNIIEAKNKVKAIRLIQTDYEAAHGLEDKLYLDFIKHIAANSKDILEILLLKGFMLLIIVLQVVILQANVFALGCHFLYISKQKVRFVPLYTSKNLFAKLK